MVWAMATTDKTLRIKKYANRRFYDATRSCHVTLADMHDLVCEGYDLSVTDSRSGEDITHQVLTQILLERDTAKLGIFPANILHDMIRTQQQMLGGVMMNFFRQVFDSYRSYGDRWAAFVRSAFGVDAAGQPQKSGPLPLDPMQWTRMFWPGATTGQPEPPGSADGPPARAGAESHSGRRQELHDLQRQIAELAKRVEELTRGDET